MHNVTNDKNNYNVYPKFVPLPPTLGSMSHLGMSTLTHQPGMFSHTLPHTHAHTHLYGTYQYIIGIDVNMDLKTFDFFNLKKIKKLNTLRFSSTQKCL